MDSEATIEYATITLILLGKQTLEIPLLKDFSRQFALGLYSLGQGREKQIRGAEEQNDLTNNN